MYCSFCLTFEMSVLFSVSLHKQCQETSDGHLCVVLSSRKTLIKAKGWMVFVSLSTGVHYAVNHTLLGWSFER